MRLAFLSAGAAQSVVSALAAEIGCENSGSFGAVGAIREKVLAGEPANLVILTATMIDALASSGHVRRDLRADLGRVRTGVAVRLGDPEPDVATPVALRAALLAAGGIYLPDPERATAGIHVAKVLETLGIHTEVAARLRPHPNGATAMRELARALESRPIGCTQITEIRNTPGVTLVAPLPKAFELATVYTAALSARASDARAAGAFLERLAGDASRPMRSAAGFEL